ncbi:MAG: CAP domain-containing protein [Solirubrobacterales bacterium]|nr:CAP domain-containing protein [Solirubrobacterales bacterium]
MIATLAVALMVFAVVMVTSVPAAQAAGQQCANAHANINKIGINKARTAFYCLLNEERKVAGVGIVESDSRIELAAQRHSQDMVKRDYFSHAAPAPAPYGRFPADRIEAAGWPYDVGASETIGGGPTPHWVLSSWLGSRGHCQILMYHGVDYVGLGWYRGTATLDVVSDMRNDYVVRSLACPRKMQTNNLPTVSKLKAVRRGKRLTVRVRTNQPTIKVRVEIYVTKTKKTLRKVVRTNKQGGATARFRVAGPKGFVNADVIIGGKVRSGRATMYR